MIPSVLDYHIYNTSVNGDMFPSQYPIPHFASSLPSPSLNTFTQTRSPHPSAIESNIALGSEPQVRVLVPTMSYKHLTCRRWMSSSASCNEYRCSYAHYYTGTMSTTLPHTCWAWAHGRCARHPDNCMWAHRHVALQIGAMQKDFGDSG